MKLRNLRPNVSASWIRSPAVMERKRRISASREAPAQRLRRFSGNEWADLDDIPANLGCSKEVGNMEH